MIDQVYRQDEKMKTLIILAFGLLITNNVYASGIYGNFYDSSDLLTPKVQFEQERKEDTSRIDEEKEQRQYEQQKREEQDEEEMKKIYR